MRCGACRTCLRPQLGKACLTNQAQVQPYGAPTSNSLLHFRAFETLILEAFFREIVVELRAPLSLNFLEELV